MNSPESWIPRRRVGEVKAENVVAATNFKKKMGASLARGGRHFLAKKYSSNIYEYHQGAPIHDRSLVLDQLADDDRGVFLTPYFDLRRFFIGCSRIASQSGVIWFPGLVKNYVLSPVFVLLW